MINKLVFNNVLNTEYRTFLGLNKRESMYQKTNAFRGSKSVTPRSETHQFSLIIFSTIQMPGNMRQSTQSFLTVSDQFTQRKLFKNIFIM